MLIVSPRFVKLVEVGEETVPLSGTTEVGVLIVVPPASDPVIAPVSSLSKIIPHFSERKVVPFAELLRSLIKLVMTS